MTLDTRVLKPHRQSVRSFDKRHASLSRTSSLHLFVFSPRTPTRRSRNWTGVRRRRPTTRIPQFCRASAAGQARKISLAGTIPPQRRDVFHWPDLKMETPYQSSRCCKAFADGGVRSRVDFFTRRSSTRTKFAQLFRELYRARLFPRFVDRPTSANPPSGHYKSREVFCNFAPPFPYWKLGMETRETGVLPKRSTASHDENCCRGVRRSERLAYWATNPNSA